MSINNIRSADRYIFSKTAAYALTHRPVKRVEIFANAINVHFLEGRSKLVSKRDFLNYFAESRRERGQQLKAQAIAPDQWEVQSSKPGNEPYDVVEEWINGRPQLKCDCYDYAAQFEYGVTTSPCCKHCYSVLDSLGYDSYRLWQGDRLSEWRRLETIAEDQRDYALVW